MTTKITLSAMAVSLLALPAQAQQMQHMQMGGQGPHQGITTPAAKEVQATGTVRKVDPAKRVVNLSHGPIQAIGWPAMTMDFAVDPKVDLSAVKAGEAVGFTLVPAAGGTYTITRLEPDAKKKG